MIVVTDNAIIDLNNVKYTKCSSAGTASAKPCIAFVMEYGDYIDRTIEISFEDYTIAHEAFEALQNAIIECEPVFDLRR